MTRLTCAIGASVATTPMTRRIEPQASASAAHWRDVEMTDEERARDLGRSWLGDSGRDELLARDILQAFAAIRADERENCAKVADRHDTGDMQREDMEARRIAASIRSGRFAAAIRARGSE